jgi:hypothetical protein
MQETPAATRGPDSLPLIFRVIGVRVADL